MTEAVLFVDDEPHLLDGISRSLRSALHDPHCHQSRQAALLSAVERMHPGLWKLELDQSGAITLSGAGPAARRSQCRPGLLRLLATAARE